MNLRETYGSRREDAYWTNSAVYSFAKVLHPGFHQSIAIPMNYVRNLFIQLPTCVSLKVVDGRVWNVGIKKREGNMVLEWGWREFVDDNGLKENDIMVFRYEDFGQVCFHIQLFDQTGYEKDKLHLYIQDNSKKRARQDKDKEAKKAKFAPVEVQTELLQKTVNPSPQEGREFIMAGPSKIATNKPDIEDVKPHINLHEKNVVNNGFQVERQSNPVETAHEIPSLGIPSRNANGEDHSKTSKKRQPTCGRRVKKKRSLVRRGCPVKDLTSEVPTDHHELPLSKRFVRNVDGEDEQKTLQKRRKAHVRTANRKETLVSQECPVKDVTMEVPTDQHVETAHEIPSLSTPTRNANGEDHSKTSQRRRPTCGRRVYKKRLLVRQGHPAKDVTSEAPTDHHALPLSKRFMRNVDAEDEQKTLQKRQTTHVRRAYRKETLVSQDCSVKDVTMEVPTDQHVPAGKRFATIVGDHNGQKTSLQRKPTRNSSCKAKKSMQEIEEKITAEPVSSNRQAQHDDSDSTIRSPVNHGKTYRLYFISQRRAVTEEERRRTFESATAISSYKPNFISVMKPSNVQKRFFLTIPQRLLRDHIPHKIKEAIVRVPPDSRTWAISLSVRSFSAGLNVGWADFVFDNNLEEGDVCLFEICGVQACGRFLIDVSIHRVVQEVVPLIRILPSPKMKGKKRG